MWIFLLVILILIILVCGISRYSYKQTYWVNKEKLRDPFKMPDGDQYDEIADVSRPLVEAAIAIPCEEVYITSHDGLKLFGRYYHKADGAPVQLLMHGYRGVALRDFSGGLQLALESGCNVLLIDERAHGNSDGKCLTFGIKERFDCIDWINYIIGRFGKDTEIILCGISMGAATVLMVTDQKLPENVKGIIADSPYSSPKEIILKVIGEMKFPVGLTYIFVRLAGKLYGGFDIESATAMDAVKNCDLPVLVIHGEADHFVPCEMGKKLAAACKNGELLTVPGAAHGISYMIDHETYSKTVKAFLNRVL